MDGNRAQRLLRYAIDQSFSDYRVTPPNSLLALGETGMGGGDAGRQVHLVRAQSFDRTETLKSADARRCPQINFCKSP
jgi:hypothetical protein